MARSENEVRLRGHVGQDPEIRTTPTGRKCAQIRMATSESWKDKQSGEPVEKTEWHTIIVWNEHIIEAVEKYVRKGAFIAIRGALQTRKWVKAGTADDDVRYATEIVLSGFNCSLDMLDKKPSNLPPPADGPPEGTPRSLASAGGHPASNGARPAPAQKGLDDEIPFMMEWR